jgi:hypothetical protein
VKPLVTVTCKTEADLYLFNEAVSTFVSDNRIVINNKMVTVVAYLRWCTANFPEGLWRSLENLSNHWWVRSSFERAIWGMQTENFKILYRYCCLHGYYIYVLITWHLIKLEKFGCEGCDSDTVLSTAGLILFIMWSLHTHIMIAHLCLNFMIYIRRAV